MNKWMQIAYDEALKGMGSNDGGPFGAIIVRDEEVISASHNKVLSSNDPTAHAEMNVIRDASQKLGRFDLSDCVLYTTCYPCPMCMGAVLWARIPTVFYGASDEDAAKEGFDDERFYTMIRQPEASLNLMPLDSAENRELFYRWLEKSDRKLY